MRKSREENEDELNQQFKHLEQEWDSFKQSNPQRLRRSCSAEIKSTFSILQLLDNSPRNLLSSLQHIQSPSEEKWKVRNNDLAVMDIPKMRREAIGSGKLLFEASESASEMGLRGREEICSACSVLIQGREMRSLSSFSSNDDRSVCGCCYSSSLSVENIAERKRLVASVGERRVTGIGNWGGDGGKWMVVMSWLAVVLMVFALGIILLRSFDGYEDEDGEILFPT